MSAILGKAQPGNAVIGSSSTDVLRDFVGTAAFSGEGTLTASGIGPQNSTGTAAFSGSGSLTVSTQPALAQIVEFSGSGSLLIVGGRNVNGQASLSGVGTLTISAGANFTDVASFSGEGFLSARVPGSTHWRLNDGTLINFLGVWDGTNIVAAHVV